VIFGLAYEYSHRATHASPKLTDRDKIVLADFANKTDDPVFGETLAAGIGGAMDQSPFLSLVSEERIQQTLGMMGQPASEALTPSMALEVCQRMGSTAVLEDRLPAWGVSMFCGCARGTAGRARSSTRSRCRPPEKRTC